MTSLKFGDNFEIKNNYSFLKMKPFCVNGTKDIKFRYYLFEIFHSGVVELFLRFSQMIVEIIKSTDNQV